MAIELRSEEDYKTIGSAVGPSLARPLEAFPMRFSTSALIASVVFLSAHSALAQTAPERDKTWGAISTASLVIGAGTELLMPRVFYADPEVTVGWKSRWHVSVLAPSMTLLGLALLNEYALKDGFEGYRPGCSENNQGGPGCRTYGMMSTHAYGGFAALGQGVAVFLFDTTKWSQGRVNGGALVGHVAVPFVAAGLNAIGRGAGNFETTGQVLAGAGAGLLTGFLMGTAYTLMQKPECGYSGSLICW